MPSERTGAARRAPRRRDALSVGVGLGQEGLRHTYSSKLLRADGHLQKMILPHEPPRRPRLALIGRAAAGATRRLPTHSRRRWASCRHDLLYSFDAGGAGGSCGFLEAAVRPSKVMECAERIAANLIQILLCCRITASEHAARTSMRAARRRGPLRRRWHAGNHRTIAASPGPPPVGVATGSGRRRLNTGASFSPLWPEGARRPRTRPSRS